MTPLQQLEDKIFDKLPELKKLGVGCEILLNGNVETIDGTYLSIEDNCDSLFKVYYGRILFDEYDIIGKPPTLVDVLKYVKELYINNSEFHQQRFKVLELWSLNSIYLRDQDEALINFLLNLEK